MGVSGRQVRVTIIQAQQLAGLDIDPVIRVDIGPESRYTSISKSTNCPYYNEFFVFDYREPTAMILDKMITISVSITLVPPERSPTQKNVKTRFSIKMKNVTSVTNVNLKLVTILASAVPEISLGRQNLKRVTRPRPRPF